jgi:FkbM family methyltransferase
MVIAIRRHRKRTHQHLAKAPPHRGMIVLSDHLRTFLATRPALRRLAWRLGRRLYVSARGEQIAVDIESDGETYLQAQVIANIPPAEKLQALDIGANQGDWTKRLLSLAPPTRYNKECLSVELFEPVPSTRERLFKMLQMTDKDGVCQVHSLAISNQAGSFQMALLSETGGTNSLHFDGSAEQPPGGWITVQTSTLMEFCARRGIDRIHLAKCDAEGHDFKILEGAKELFAAQRIDVLQFEYNHQWVFSRCYLKDVFDLVRGLPYRVGKLEPDSIEIYDDWHPELDRFFQSNYVLIAEAALGWFCIRRGSFDRSNTYA